jgi:AbrB family transcriptional regulator (stage V sporulation protein T)
LSEKGERYKMKATGIVRRIDDLGRVVIPKEIRRTMRIREGDRYRQH